jgi:hypothetical protein
MLTLDPCIKAGLSFFHSFNYFLKPVRLVSLSTIQSYSVAMRRTIDKWWKLLSKS